MNRLKVVVCALALNLIWAFPMQLHAEDLTGFYDSVTSGVTIAISFGGIVDFSGTE